MPRVQRLITLLVSALAGVCATNNGFPNSLGATPPMGWRSWNAFRQSINQTLISAQVDGIVKQRANLYAGMTGASAAPTVSLHDLGFTRVGIDDGWEACGAGVNGSFHNATGWPLINTDLFPDMGGLVAYAHGLNVSMEWYMNCCGCGGQERNLSEPHYTQDAIVTAQLGFDGLKVDACGNEPNITAWAAALNATGRPIMLENCNDNYPFRPSGSPPDCPYNFFRTSIDNAPHFLSGVSNMLDSVAFLSVSAPGCWAYPDMLEIGAPVANAPPYDNLCGSRLNASEARGEYAGWAVLSSPLILGLDLSNDTEVDLWWPIISNPAVISINQAWAGSAGALLAQSAGSYTYLTPHGSACEVAFNRSMPYWTAWGKPLPAALGLGSFAAVVMNSWSGPINASVPFSAMGFPSTATLTATDVWTGAQTRISGPAWTVSGLAAHESVFVTLQAA